MGTEKLKFKLELYATMWDKPPHAEILVNDVSHFSSDITGTEEKPDVIEFEAEVEQDKSHALIISRSGKSASQTWVDRKIKKVTKDQLLHIKNIEIDWSPLRDVTEVGVYTPDYPEPWATQQREQLKRTGGILQESFNGVTDLGHNGEWRLTFTSPFHMWLLKHPYRTREIQKNPNQKIVGD